MKFTAVVAMDEARGIGKDNQLLWHLPADLKHFKQLTLGKPIIMGRKTFASIGKPLPNRLNIVLTRDVTFNPNGVTVVHDTKTIFKLLASEPEVMIIGGSEIYRLFWPHVTQLELTIVHHRFDADTFLTVFNAEEWHEIRHEKHLADEINPYPYTFLTLIKK